MGRYIIVEVVDRVADEGGAGTGHADQLRQRAITSSKLHELAVVRDPEDVANTDAGEHCAPFHVKCELGALYVGVKPLPAQSAQFSAATAVWCRTIRT